MCKCVAWHITGIWVTTLSSCMLLICFNRWPSPIQTTYLQGEKNTYLRLWFPFAIWLCIFLKVPRDEPQRAALKTTTGGQKYQRESHRQSVQQGGVDNHWGITEFTVMNSQHVTVIYKKWNRILQNLSKESKCTVMHCLLSVRTITLGFCFCFFKNWATAVRLLNQTTQASLHSPPASVSLGRPSPCCWFITVASLDHFWRQHVNLFPKMTCWCNYRLIDHTARQTFFFL